jgi:toxin YoeB
MVRRVVWTNRALKDRYQILSYWINNNQSNSYSKILDSLFIETLSLLCEYPFLGKKTKSLNVRLKIIKKYNIVYQINNNEIIVLRVWDSRQNPQKLKF